MPACIADLRADPGATGSSVSRRSTLPASVGSVRSLGSRACARSCGSAPHVLSARPMARLRVLGGVQRVEHSLRLRLDPGQHVAELAKLGLDRAQHLPDRSCAFPSASVRKPIYKAFSIAINVVGPASVTRCSRCSAPSDPVGAAPRRTGLRWAETRWRSRSCGAAPGISRPSTGFQADVAPARAAVSTPSASALLRVEQAFVVFVGKTFGIDRQPARRTIPARARVGWIAKSTTLRLLRPGGDLLGVLVGRKHLFQQRAQLRPSPNMPRVFTLTAGA